MGHQDGSLRPWAVWQVQQEAAASGERGVGGGEQRKPPLKVSWMLGRRKREPCHVYSGHRNGGVRPIVLPNGAFWRYNGMT